MSRISRLADHQANLAGQEELQRAAAAVQAAAAADRQEAVVYANLATVDRVRAWGDALDVPAVVESVAAGVGELGVTATRHGLAWGRPCVTIHQALWMPHGPATKSWEAAATASPMPHEVRGMRAWRVELDDRKVPALPRALILLYQEQGEFAGEAPRLAVVDPALNMGDASHPEQLQQVLLGESRQGCRAALLKQALDLDEVLAAYVRDRGRIARRPSQLTEEQTGQIAFMYYVARLFDSWDALKLDWKEAMVTEAIVAKQYQRAAWLLQVDTYDNCDSNYTDRTGRILGRQVKTGGPLTVSDHLENLEIIHWALNNARENGSIAGSGIETPGPSLFAYSLGSHARSMPGDPGLPGTVRADVAETAKRLPELQAMLAAPRIELGRRWGVVPVRHQIAGGMIGENSVPVLLEGDAGIRVARSELTDMLDKYFAQQWAARQAGRRS